MTTEAQIEAAAEAHYESQRKREGWISWRALWPSAKEKCLTDMRAALVAAEAARCQPLPDPAGEDAGDG